MLSSPLLTSVTDPHLPRKACTQPHLQALYRTLRLKINGPHPQEVTSDFTFQCNQIERQGRLRFSNIADQVFWIPKDAFLDIAKTQPHLSEGKIWNRVKDVQVILIKEEEGDFWRPKRWWGEDGEKREAVMTNGHTNGGE